MYQIDENSSPKEMLNFLRGATAPEIVAVCVVVRKISEYAVSTSGTKEQLLHGLRGVPGEILYCAIDAVFPSEECDDDLESEDDDEDCECEENAADSDDEDDEE